MGPYEVDEDADEEGGALGGEHGALERADAGVGEGPDLEHVEQGRQRHEQRDRQLLRRPRPQEDDQTCPPSSLSSRRTRGPARAVLRLTGSCLQVRVRRASEPRASVARGVAPNKGPRQHRGGRTRHDELPRHFQNLVVVLLDWSPHAR
eukprot:2033392-Rhodomonas_salina.1